MRRICIGLFLLMGIGPALADSLGYEVRGSEVFYGKRVYVYAFWRTEAEKIARADGSTFRILNKTTYAKDASRAFHEGREVAGADAATFELVPGGGAQYAKDARRVYAEGSPLPEADPGSFRVDAKTPGLARDRRQVYFNRKVIRGADPATYELLRGASAIGRDRKGYYFGSEPVAVRDPATFEVMTVNPQPGEMWAKDAKAFYVGAKTTAAGGGSKLEILGEGYSKDGTRVFYKDEVIAGADAATFTVRVHKDDAVKGQRFVVARDRRHFYTSDTPTADVADGATFEELGRGYARDSRQVYFLSSVVEGADPASFSTAEVRGVAGANRGAPVVSDKNRAYQCGNALN